MGTSGSYGGSASSAWALARRRLESMTPMAGGGGESDPGSDTAAGEAAAALAAALLNGEANLRRRTPPNYDLGQLLPRARTPGGGGRGGGGGGGGGGRASSSGGGRTGGGSRRSVTKNALRGGAAVAAAYALRRGDAAGLADLGLNLADLAPMTPFAQCDRIIERILGNETHPDDHALRRASVEAVAAILTAGAAPQPIDVVRGLVADLVWQQGLVELRARRSGGTDAHTVSGLEKRVKAWIKASVQAMPAPASGFMTVKAIVSSVASLAQSAVRIIGAGT
jgi:hypothetical protein